MVKALQIGQRVTHRSRHLDLLQFLRDLCLEPVRVVRRLLPRYLLLAEPANTSLLLLMLLSSIQSSVDYFWFLHEFCCCGVVG